MAARYRVSSQKALEVILYLAGKRGKLDFYHIAKILFYADKYHLNIYGRPIVGDTYIAMPHGPVPQVVYNILKSDEIEYQSLEDQLGMANDPNPFEIRDRYWVHPTRTADVNLLSESDIEALDFAYNEHIEKSFRELEKLTHSEKAYLAAVEGDARLDYCDMIDESEGAAAKIADIKKTSRSIAFS